MNNAKTIASMKVLHGSLFSPCACGRTDVLLYRAAKGAQGASNGPDADRFTYHDTPAGARCEHGGKLVSELLR